MKILLLTRYGRLGASSRVRSLQYIDYLSSKGMVVDVFPLFSNDYLTALYSGQSYWKEVLLSYWRRMRKLFSLSDYDLIWLEKELFPFFPAIIERLLGILGVRYVVDYDDALFHRYDLHKSWLVRTFLGKKIDVVMRSSALVIVGNDYLAQRARDAGAKKIEIVPTVVDLDRYVPLPKQSRQHVVIGWIGSPSTECYLLKLIPVFVRLKNKFNVSFVAIGANQKNFKHSPVDVVPWSEDTEVGAIQNFDIGIMPLTDSPWEQGKCGYKLIQYMACEVPVVASAVGVNKQIIKQGENGFLIESFSEWEGQLGRLLADKVLRQTMGIKGREQVESWYSLQKQAPRLARMMKR